VATFKTVKARAKVKKNSTSIEESKGKLGLGANGTEPPVIKFPITAAAQAPSVWKIM